MISVPALHLALHGAVVLLVGLLAGFPYGRSITTPQSGGSVDPAERERAWRLAHSASTMGGTMMLAFAALLPDVTRSGYTPWLIVIATIVAGYGFVVAMLVAAFAGVRGLEPRGGPANRFVFSSYAIAVVASLLSVSMLLTAIIGRLASAS